MITDEPILNISDQIRGFISFLLAYKYSIRSSSCFSQQVWTADGIHMKIKPVNSQQKSLPVL